MDKIYLNIPQAELLVEAVDAVEDPLLQGVQDVWSVVF